MNHLLHPLSSLKCVFFFLTGFTLSVYPQILTDDLSGILSFSGTRGITGIVGQAAFEPGDDSHVYVATFGGGIIRYDYDPSAATAGAIFSNPIRAVPQLISGSNEVDGSLALAFHEDPTLGTVMYIAPTVGFGGSVSDLRVQSIIRLTDDNNNGVWGETGEVAQSIVDNIIVSRLHMINNMQIRGDILWVGIGVRTQNGGQTAAQNSASGGNGTDQASPGETAYTGTVAFIGDLTQLSNDTTTKNLAGFDIPGLTSVGGFTSASLVNDVQARTDIQPFTSTDAGKLRIWATGFRNNVGLGVDDTGEIWVSYNENENPQAPDKLHRAVTIKSDHKFFKGNAEMGDWKAVGDEANATLTARNQAVLDAGWFNDASTVDPHALLDNNTAAGGLDFFPSDFPVSEYAGDVLVSRNSGGGNDVVLVDRDTGNKSVLLEGLGGALQVDRDPFGNFIVGGSSRIGLIKVDGTPSPPPSSPEDKILYLSFGESQGSADQEQINGETWNNIVGENNTDSTLQFADGTDATGVSVTTDLDGPSNGSSENPDAAGYIAGYDTVTTTLLFSEDVPGIFNGTEGITVTIDGLIPGVQYDLGLYIGLNDNVPYSDPTRGMEISINGQSLGRQNFTATYNSGDTYDVSQVTADSQGRITLEFENGDRIIYQGFNWVETVLIQAISVKPTEQQSIGDLYFSFGEQSSVQETIEGKVWNNVVGVNIIDSTLQYDTGNTATGVAIQVSATGQPVGTNPSYPPGIGYVSAALDTVTAPLVFADDGNFSDGIDESLTLTLTGLSPGTEYDLDMYFGLNENRGQDVTVNGQFSGHPNFHNVYQSQQPYAVNTVTADEQGRITILLSNGDRFNGVVEVALIQALGVKVSPTQTVPPSTFVNACLAYGGGAFGSPAEAFRFHPFLDGALFSGPNDINGGSPTQLLTGSSIGFDPSDGGLNADKLPAGTYSFLIQENQLVRTEYELAFVTAQAPGSSNNTPPAELRETIGTDSISNDYANPNTLTLGLGTNIVAGEVGGTGSGALLADGSASGTDGDYFTIVVPQGLIVTNVIVNRYNQLQRGFLIYDTGATLSPIILQNSGIALNKEPLYAGETAGFDNYSNYSRGINRVVLMIGDLPNDGGDLSTSDFIFRVGNESDPASWVDAPLPSEISVRPGLGDDGSDLVTLTWADNAIRDQWLQVTVLSNDNTALPPDFELATGLPNTMAAVQFYFGNARFDSGLPVNQPAAVVTFTDAINAFLNQTLPGEAAITNAYDYNRDGSVTFTDAINAFLNQNTQASAMQLISPPGGFTIGPDLRRQDAWRYAMNYWEMLKPIP